MKAKQKDTLPPLPTNGVIRPWGSTALGVAGARVYNGKFRGESVVSFSISLPLLPLPAWRETERYLEEVARAYLFFLQKESQKKRDGVALGAISFRFDGLDLILSGAFCPFGKRTYRDLARLTLRKTGDIEEIRL